MAPLIYPGGDEQETLNLGLATWGMDEVLAHNMILIDAAIVAPPAIKSVRVNYVVDNGDLNLNNGYLGSDSGNNGILITWPTPFVDANYTVTYSYQFETPNFQSLNNFYTPMILYNKTAASFVVTSATPSGATPGDVITIHAIAVHD